MQNDCFIEKKTQKILTTKRMVRVPTSMTPTSGPGFFELSMFLSVTIEAPRNNVNYFIIDTLYHRNDNKIAELPTDK